MDMDKAELLLDMILIIIGLLGSVIVNEIRSIGDKLRDKEDV